MPDPLDASDSCFFMEATSGDNGNHTAPVWWLSPDVDITAPAPSKATIGQSNTVQLRVHRNASCPGSQDAFVELWVGNPALAMAPNVNTELLSGFVTVANVPSGGAQTQTFAWNPTGSGAQTAGHKCLVARCFPTDQSPDPISFWLPASRHAVQHNIEVVAAPAGGAPKMRISTGNPDKERRQRVTVNAVAEIRPSRFVLQAITPAVRQVRGFQRFATAAPREFTLNFSAFQRRLNLTVLRPGLPIAVSRGVPLPQMVVTPFLRRARDTNLFGRLNRPNVVGQLGLNPQVFDTFEFSVDLSRSRPGDAHIFHLTQTGADRKPHGGLTVVVVAR
jgi:hypothetical protein